jgi:hypothetical protein
MRRVALTRDAVSRTQHGLCVPVARVLGLVGSLAVLAAYFMPWFGTQGLILTGQFLHLLLSSSRDLSQFLPTSSPLEVQLLRGLVDFFPVMGGAAAVLAVVATARPGWRAWCNPLLIVCGVAVLIGLVGGTQRLPPGSSLEVGLWTIALGGVLILLGVAVDLMPVKSASH